MSNIIKEEIEIPELWTLLKIQALVGLLYLTGILKSSRLNVDEVWNTKETGVEIFRLALEKNGFR